MEIGLQTDTDFSSVALLLMNRLLAGDGSSIRNGALYESTTAKLVLNLVMAFGNK